MVLTFKKDWSPDLSYSSLAQDQKVNKRRWSGDPPSRRAWQRYV